MAKRGTLAHPKTIKLASLLKLPPYAALGLLEALWHWTARYAPRGDVGQYDDAAISMGMTWEKRPKVLIDALLECEWLEEHEDPRVRLIVHDWKDHCDQTVKRWLERAGLRFAESTKRLVIDESKASQKLVCDESKASLSLDSRAQPEPEPEPSQSQSQRKLASKLASGSALLDLSDEFRKAWDHWLQHLEGRDKAIGPPVQRAQLARLEELGPERAVATVRLAIAKGWVSLHPEGEPRGRTGEGDTPTVFTSAEEARELCR